MSNDEWVDGPPPGEHLPAGVLLEVRGKLEPETMLVGHVNTSGGACNCCLLVEPEDVIRHRFVWREDAR